MSLIMYLCIYILLFLVVVIIVLLLAKPTYYVCVLVHDVNRLYFTLLLVSTRHSISQKKALHTCTSSYSPCTPPQMWETSSRNLVPVCLPTISPSLVATSPARGVILSTTETISSISRCRLPRSVSRSTPTGLGAVVSPSGLARTQNTC